MIAIDRETKLFCRIRPEFLRKGYRLFGTGAPLAARDRQRLLKTIRRVTATGREQTVEIRSGVRVFECRLSQCRKGGIDCAIVDRGFV